ncbi:MAG: hypothetical protein AB7S54_10480 [Bacteroidales bacterium]
MKKTVLGLLAAMLISALSTAQNTNIYKGKVIYGGREYYYETSCAGVKPMVTTTIETYGLTIYRVKKDIKKPFLKTHCTALELRRNDSAIKENVDKITFTTMVGNRLSPEVEGTSKKVTLNFQLDNFTLIPLYNPGARRGCANFGEAITNVVYFVLKELD